MSATGVEVLQETFNEDKRLRANYRKARFYRQLVNEKTIRKDLALLEELKRSSVSQESQQLDIRKLLKKVGSLIESNLPSIENLAAKALEISSTLKSGYELVYKVATLETYLQPQLTNLDMRAWNLRTVIIPITLKENMFRESKRAKAIIKVLRRQLPSFFLNSIEVIGSTANLFNTYVRKILNGNTTEHDGYEIPLTLVNGQKAEMLRSIDDFYEVAEAILQQMNQFHDLTADLSKHTDKASFNTFYSGVTKNVDGIMENNRKLLPVSQQLIGAFKKVSDTIMENTASFDNAQMKTKDTLMNLAEYIAKYNYFLQRYDFVKREEYFSNLTNTAYDLVPIWRNITKERLIACFTPAETIREQITGYERANSKLINLLLEIEAMKDQYDIVVQFDSVARKLIRNSPAMNNSETSSLLANLDDLVRSIHSLLKPIKVIQMSSDYFLHMVRCVLEETARFNRTLLIDEKMIR
jgi:hypothetical protein